MIALLSLAALAAEPSLPDARLLVIADSAQPLTVDGRAYGEDTTFWVDLQSGLHRVTIGTERMRLWVEAGEEARLMLNGDALIVDEPVPLPRGWQRAGVQASAPVVDGIPTTPTEVAFRSDGDWVNLRVDGRQVAELRSFDREVSVSLEPGVHTLAVWDFLDHTCIDTLQLTVRGDETLVLGVDDGGFEKIARY